MAATLKLEIITPEGVAFSDDVEMVTLPGVEGEMGIFPMHSPLMTQIVPGGVSVRQKGRDILLAVGEGFVEITGDHVAVLADMAVEADGIDERKVEEARRAAETRLQEKLSDEEEAVARAALANSLAQLKIKRRGRG
jgi:F-type H+-transporting ATPase subunit epsilon